MGINGNFTPFHCRQHTRPIRIYGYFTKITIFIMIILNYFRAPSSFVASAPASGFKPRVGSNIYGVDRTSWVIGSYSSELWLRILEQRRLKSCRADLESLRTVTPQKKINTNLFISVQRQNSVKTDSKFLERKRITKLLLNIAYLNNKSSPTNLHCGWEQLA